MFGTIETPSLGYNLIVRSGGPNGSMRMDAGYVKLAAKQVYQAGSREMETAVLLLAGSVAFHWEQNQAQTDRPNSFDYLPACLHLPPGGFATVGANSDAELLVLQTENDRGFHAKFYAPQDTIHVKAGKTELNGCARRDIRTVFDYSNAPWSNIVVGEVVSLPGRWSSYPPHHHPQPELYFYRFDKPQGFGACFINDDAFKIRHLSYAAIPGGNTHPQATAPGYALHYVWAIRHLPGAPWKATRIGAAEHDWMLEQGAKIWQPQD